MLEECLKGIERQTYGKLEVLVIDDALSGHVRPAEKRNLGIAKAKGEIIAFIDDDAYPDENWLERALVHFEDASIGAVGGPGVTPPGDDFRRKLSGRVYDNVLVSGNFRYRYKASGKLRDVEDFPSCNLLVRKSVLERIGGYRTDFWPGEDTLLCKDIIDSGLRIVYEPRALVYHHRRALFAPHVRQLGRYAFHRGYFVKRYPSNSLRLGYFVPSAFVGYLLTLWAAYWTSWYLLPLGVYLALVTIASFAWNPVVWAWTALGIVISHLIYGVRFVQGLCARKAPCEFIGKDHAGGI